MLKFYKYLLIFIGAIALCDFFTLLLNYQEIKNYNILSFAVNKTIYTIYKFVIGMVLIISGIKTKHK